MAEEKRLFAEFPPVSTEEWMAKIEADLKGADFERKLVWRSREGIDVRSFYREEDMKTISHLGSNPGEFPYVRGGEKVNNSWFVRQDIIVSDPLEANKKALEVLNRGVDSLGFRFNKETKFTPGYIATLLKGIFIESIELNFAPEGSAIELLESVQDYVSEAGVKPTLLKINIETDPLGRYMVNGKLCVSLEEGISYLVKLARLVKWPGNIRVIRANGANFTNAGASVVQELAMTISQGNEYMVNLTDHGLEPSHAASLLGFTFGIGSNYFFEIARLRAARMLWALVLKGYGVDSAPAAVMKIHAVTGEWNKTVYDPYVNMLRTQTEAMSATLGGVDSLTVLPFDSVFSEPTPFSERIARNQQLLLKEEAHFGRIVDPGAGSYYIEELTSSVGRAAWELFLEIEKEGGFTASLRSGLVQKRVETNAEMRNQNLAKGREKLLGTNIYPNQKELSKAGYSAGKKALADTEIKPLHLYRGAEMFENLRMATEKSGRKPLVFMLPLGNPGMRKARAQFSAGFFAVAGYQIMDNIGFKTPGEGINAAIGAKADIVVICSSDDEYATIVPEIFNALKGKAVVVVAGAPACEPELREAGVEHFISLKSDILRSLESFNAILGIK